MTVVKLCKVLGRSSISSLKFQMLNSIDKAKVCITLFFKTFLKPNFTLKVSVFPRIFI